MREKYVLVFGIFLACLTLVSASFTVGDLSHSVSTKYLKNSYLTGWTNLSFDLQPFNSVFTDSLGNSVGLEEVLNSSENSGFNYECNVEGCAEDYETSNAQETKKFTLANTKTKLVGFKIDENILGINSIDFQLESDVGASCNNQIRLDILDDGEIDFLNTKLSGFLCPDINKGCFDDGASSEEISISTTPICQRINFTEAPKYQAGAWVKQVEAGSKNIWMQVFTLEGAKAEECSIDKGDISSSGTYVSCNIDLAVLSPKEYYVCLVSDAGSGDYKSRGYNPSEPCGFAGIPPQTETSAYDIYIQKRKYDAIGTLNITNDLPSGEDFGEIVEEYIIERYGNLNCSEGCVVPVKIISGDNQEITLKNLDFNYNKIGLPGVSETNFYDVAKSPAKISTDKFQKLNLNNFFALPNNSGSFIYDLKLNNEKVFEENITIKNISIEVSPLKTAAEIETEFELTISPEENIEDYFWNFGDGTTIPTNSTKVSHKYSNIENYTLEITLNYNENESVSKSFLIEVGSPKNYINSTIEELRAKINSIRMQINEFDFFVVEQLEKILELEEIEGRLNNISLDINSSNEEILEIIRDLQNIQIPDQIISSSTGEVLYYFSKDKISLNLLAEACDENYSSFNEQDYLDSILFWNQKNLETRISSIKISAQYGNSFSDLLKVFEMKFDKKDNSIPYLIIRNLENLAFNIPESELSEGKSVQINPSLNSLKFSTTEDINNENLNAFISPGFSELQISEGDSGIIIEEEKNNKYLIWVLIIGVLLLGAVIYFYLHKWYKTKYETKLFKDRNNLYNLSHYIHNARANKTDDAEIRKNLKKVGWNAEQIRYAMRKYSGKNTGMPGLNNSSKKMTQSKLNKMHTQKTQKVNKQRKLNR